MINKISIALCTFNGANFLSAQLESFLQQTRLPDELIVCDDCSNDETVKILKDFASNLPFPVQIYVNEKNLRSTKNFEKAIALCTGELIFLSDQDDVWFAEKIAKIEAEFDKNPKVGMVFSDAEIVDENLQSLGNNLFDFTFPEKKRNGQIFDILLSQNAVTGATMAFRAEFRQKFTPIPDDIPNLIHDAWIALSIAALAKIAFIDAPLVKYRQHTAQQLGINFESARTKNYDERQKNYAEAIEFLQKETARLEHLSEIFFEFPQFEKKRETVDFAKLIEEKTEQIKHLEARMNLSLAKIWRVLPVFKEVFSGRYGRFSKGFLSAGKDLLEK